MHKSHLMCRLRLLQRMASYPSPSPRWLQAGQWAVHLELLVKGLIELQGFILLMYWRHKLSLSQTILPEIKKEICISLWDEEYEVRGWAWTQWGRATTKKSKPEPSAHPCPSLCCPPLPGGDVRRRSGTWTTSPCCPLGLYIYGARSLSSTKRNIMGEMRPSWGGFHPITAPPGKQA